MCGGQAAIPQKKRIGAETPPATATDERKLGTLFEPQHECVHAPGQPLKPRAAVAGPLLQHHWWFSQAESVNKHKKRKSENCFEGDSVNQKKRDVYFKGKSFKNIIMYPIGNFSCVYKIDTKTSLAL